jgi:hypothetical protein
MESVGINWTLLLAQIINVLLICAWVVMAIMALRQLRRRSLPSLARAIWAAIIVLMPLLGALAFFIVRPMSPTDT